MIGLDLFPSLGISVSGVPVDFPGTTDNDEYIIDPTNLLQSEWQDKHQVPPEMRRQLMVAIQPLIDANAAMPIGTFCNHPSAVVPVDTGDAKPVYTPQYRPSEVIGHFIDQQVQQWLANGVICLAPPDSPWNSPIMGAWDRASKLKGKDPRVCIDPRKLNDFVVQ